MRIKISIVRKCVCIQQFILRLQPGFQSILFPKLIIGEGLLWVFIQILHVVVGRGIIEIIIQLLHIFTVIAFIVNQTKHPFFDDRILVVPQGYRKIQVLEKIRNARDAVFAPQISATVCVLKGKVAPGIAVLAVIFAYRSPLSFTQVGSPLLQGYFFL